MEGGYSDSSALEAAEYLEKNRIREVVEVINMLN
jgi:hypothetical protein